jgi:hypothetical protein
MAHKMYWIEDRAASGSGTSAAINQTLGRLKPPSAGRYIRDLSKPVFAGLNTLESNKKSAR